MLHTEFINIQNSNIYFESLFLIESDGTYWKEFEVFKY